MGENSKIEWCHSTFNPWRGCRALSPACDNCYAKTLVEGRLGESFDSRTRAAGSTWKQPLSWNRKAAKLGVRYRVFCASLADVFDAEVPDEWRDDLFALIAATPHLDWLLLTKRPKVARDYADRAARCGEHWLADKGAPPVQWPLPNVWLGTTVENQAMAEARIPHLLATPAAVRFLSCEPLLGPLNISNYLWPVHGWWKGPYHSYREAKAAGAECGLKRQALVSAHARFVDWVIAGGESGPKARPSHPDWFRSLRDQCAAAGVPFLMKQWGEWAPTQPVPGGDLGGDMRAGRVRIVKPAGENDGHFRRGDALMERVGKKSAGRMLDGVLHDALPAVRS
ncbi:hypothetical protein TSH58p_17440 [Azospirillum sp. TSH58]|uniref:phage Gp37/Gp68 family protein n=1 Tax=Azospirillum sp. TSH58 TaxID=664962 RepID=UPI000D5FEEEE|nr:phage Gp37/Gp68 family protein [Azospirillum sp. TSH58]AWJ85149.1 hypothetical protein TSH58p_17440 [Azospirillum sp. TSH58]PWC80824.1 hypothetical protein TSH58_00845 [Azospirillum sp. TSH58]